MVVAAIVTFLSAGLLTPLLTTWAHRKNLLDIPNERSSHVVATPRIGGLALVASVLAGVATFGSFNPALGREARFVLGGAVVIAVLGLLDDFWQLSALPRLLVQAAVAVVTVNAIGPAQIPWLEPDAFAASCVTVFWIVALTNAYNFMDGIDGIAGAQALVAGIGWTAVGLLAGSPDIAALGLIVAGASGGFLLHNWHPAKVFMGDGGSGFLGFLFASVPLLAPGGHTAFLWYAALLVWPFLFDTGFTVLRRTRRSENLLSAHRSHLYQRLVLTGRSHSYVTLVYAGLALLGTAAAIARASHIAVLPLLSMIVILIAGGGLWWNVISREAAGNQRPSKPSAL
jgi:UDP-N-acetylmuramyl pentapeptide phosphotransferase/UDP-N-acetylglucosamine-1-phosphate transferase